MSSNTLGQSIDNQQEQLLSSQQHEAQLQLENSINSITTGIESTQAEQVMQLGKDALRELSNNGVDLNTLLSSNLTTGLNPLQAFLNNVSSQPKFLNLFSIALKETNPRHKHYDKAFGKMKSKIQLLVSKQIDKQHESESVFARTKLEKAKDDELKAQEKHDLEAYSPDKGEQISSAIGFASTEQMMQQVKSSPGFANYRQSYGSDQEMEAGILSFYRTQAQLSAKGVDDPFVNSFDKIKKDLQLPAAINASDISSMSELRDVNNATIMQSGLNNYAQISEAETNYNAIDRNSLDNDDALEMGAYHSLDDMTSSRDDIRTNMGLLGANSPMSSGDAQQYHEANTGLKSWLTNYIDPNFFVLSAENQEAAFTSATKSLSGIQIEQYTNLQSVKHNLQNKYDGHAHEITDNNVQDAEVKVAKMASNLGRTEGVRSFLNTVVDSMSMMLNSDNSLINEVELDPNTITLDPQGNFACKFSMGPDGPTYDLKVNRNTSLGGANTGEIQITSLLNNNTSADVFKMDTEDIGITIPTVKDLETNALSMLTPSTMGELCENSIGTDNPLGNFEDAFRKTLRDKNQSFMKENFEDKKELIQTQFAHHLKKNQASESMINMLNTLSVANGQTDQLINREDLQNKGIDAKIQPDLFKYLKMADNTSQFNSVNENQGFLASLSGFTDMISNLSANSDSVSDHLFQKYIVANPEHGGDPSQSFVSRTNSLLSKFMMGPDNQNLIDSPDTNSVAQSQNHLDTNFLNAYIQTLQTESGSLTGSTSGFEQTVHSMVGPNEKLDQTYKNNQEHLRNSLSAEYQQFRSENMRKNIANEVAKTQAEDEKAIASVDEGTKFDTLDGAYKEQVLAHEENPESGSSDTYVAQNGVRSEIKVTSTGKDAYASFLQFKATFDPVSMQPKPGQEQNCPTQLAYGTVTDGTPKMHHTINFKDLVQKHGMEVDSHTFKDYLASCRVEQQQAA